MDKVTRETLDRVVFTNAYHRSSFGSPKLSFVGRAKADEVAEAIREMRKGRLPIKNTGPSSPFVRQIHREQIKYIARDLFIWCFEETSPNGMILKRIGTQKLNKTRYSKLVKKVRAPFARDILHAFYNREHKPNWWHLFRVCSAWCIGVEDEAKYVQRLAESFKDAMPPEGSPSTLEPKYRTSTVMGLIRNMRSTEALGNFPILADALQDAGYERNELLERYRDPDAIFTLGSWIFRATGNLETNRGGMGDGGSEVHAD